MTESPVETLQDDRAGTPGGVEETPERLRLYRRLLSGAAILLAVLVLVDPLLGAKPYFEVQTLPAFTALLGLGAGLVLVAASVALRALLARREGYYDD